ncbi:hypothetical protein M426DRAFT_153580 [Hypoxylon sp. CI-4A]|nr:hypothetical protein M426DRAFT_153580 [Hypoxylon sp. CI-4A]
MHANFLSTFALLALGSLSGTALANDRWKLTWYEDAFCGDFLGTTSSPDPQGCTNFGSSVNIPSVKMEGEVSRCGHLVKVYAGRDCNGASDRWTTLTDGPCTRVQNQEGYWMSYSVTANPC